MDDLVNEMADERLNHEIEVRGLRQDLKDAEATRQRDREELEERIKTLEKGRQTEKSASMKISAQFMKVNDKLRKLEDENTAVKNIQDALTAKIDEDVSSKLAVYMASKNEYVRTELLKHTEITKEYVTTRTASLDGVLKEDMSRCCKDLQEASDRAAEERLEVVRKDFETRLTENNKALSAYGKDVTRYVDVVDPLSADIYALKEELTAHHKSLKDEIQEHLAQAKLYTDQSMSTVDLSNISRDRLIWDHIDLVEAVQVSVLEAKMDESKAQQDRLVAKQNETREELGAQKKQHHTFRSLVEKGRKDIDDRHGKLATKVHNQDSFLGSFFKEYSSV
jgi:DNA repair exonuclease SbcCD ATPase subunit